MCHVTALSTPLGACARGERVLAHRGGGACARGVECLRKGVIHKEDATFSGVVVVAAVASAWDAAVVGDGVAVVLLAWLL